MHKVEHKAVPATQLKSVGLHPAGQKACDLAACNHCGDPGTCSLNQLGIGCSGSVVAVGGDPEIRRRLLEMGFCNGANVEVIRRAPLGDPIEFRLRGYCLSLRGEQAQHVRIAMK